MYVHVVSDDPIRNPVGANVHMKGGETKTNFPGIVVGKRSGLRAINPLLTATDKGPDAAPPADRDQGEPLTSAPPVETTTSVYDWHARGVLVMKGDTLYRPEELYRAVGVEPFLASTEMNR